MFKTNGGSHMLCPDSLAEKARKLHLEIRHTLRQKISRARLAEKRRALLEKKRLSASREAIPPICMRFDGCKWVHFRRRKDDRELDSDDDTRDEDLVPGNGYCSDGDDFLFDDSYAEQQGGELDLEQQPVVGSGKDLSGDKRKEECTNEFPEYSDQDWEILADGLPLTQDEDPEV